MDGFARKIKLSMCGIILFNLLHLEANVQELTQNTYSFQYFFHEMSLIFGSKLTMFDKKKISKSLKQ